MSEARDLVLVENGARDKSGDYLTQKLNETRAGLKSDSLKKVTLDYVALGRYEAAKAEINAFIDSKTDFPDFLRKASPLRIHCVDLVAAIEAKRNFPGLQSLTLSKQHEISDKVVSHFNELKQLLVHIEALSRDSKLMDVKSTVWVIKAFYNSLFLMVAVAFIMEITSGLGFSMHIVFEALVEDLTNFILRYF